MAIANRVKRLFQADVHAILDIIEEPEAILKQAIREMQEALDLKKARLARCQGSLQALRDNRSYLVEELSKIQKDLELCLAEGSEELGRKTVGRRLAFQKYLATVEQRISTAENLCHQQENEIELQQEQLESIVEKAKLFVQTAADDSPFSVADSVLSTAEQRMGRAHPRSARAHVSDEEVELEWLRLQGERGEA